ncbi:MAG: pilus assembly protein PilX [Ruminococcus sp.]|nr:pilus assembly protein PilX [Ruminococcus sp.]
MRKINAVISMAVLALFLVHAVAGGFQLAGVMPGGSTVMSILAWVMTALIGVHIVIGIKLTADSLKAIKRSGKSYLKENKLFWIRRISGFAIMFFILFHILIFMGKTSDGVYRLEAFETLQLISQILLVVTIALHVISNARPMLLSFGIKSFKEIGIDIALVLCFVLIFTAAAFIIYYIRWNVI